MLVDAKRENVCRLLEKAQSYVKLRSHRGTEMDGPAQSAILLVRESVGSIETSSHVSVDKDALSLIHDLANRWDRSAMSRKSRLVLVHLVASYIAGIPFLFMNISIFLLAPLAMLVAIPTCVLGFFRQVFGEYLAENDAYLRT